MSNHYQHIIDDQLPWLLELDRENPGVRYFALRDLLARSNNDPDVRQAQTEVMTQGPVPAILDAQQPEGFWVKPGGGYWPSYRATVWQVIFLAELGADPHDERVQRGFEYLLSHSIASNGGFSMSARPVPSKVVHCLNGDVLHALLQLGYAAAGYLQAAVDWQAHAIAGAERIRYYKSGTTGPNFACVANQAQPCAWGATKALKALAIIPHRQRTPSVQYAIELGTQFLLSHDPAVADYPYVDRVNSTWFKFGFPLSYRSDVLETVAVLVNLGYGEDPHLENTLEFILSKQDSQGRWAMEKNLNGKMWIDIETQGQPSKWITLRVLRVLKMIEAHEK